MGVSGSRKYTIKEMFWSRIKIIPGGCWLWLGPKLPSGYGQICISRRTVYVHRYMYEKAKGKISPGRDIHHICDVRNCVKPGHLENVSTFDHPGKGFKKPESCKRGHKFTSINTRYYEAADGGVRRQCRACDSLNQGMKRTRQKNNLNLKQS